MKRLLKRALASGLSRTMLAAVAGAGLAAASLPAQAVEYPVNFGEPVVLSPFGPLPWPSWWRTPKSPMASVPPLPATSSSCGRMRRRT